jgi:hypothetical protein
MSCVQDTLRCMLAFSEKFCELIDFYTCRSRANKNNMTNAQLGNDRKTGTKFVHFNKQVFRFDTNQRIGLGMLVDGPVVVERIL